MRCTAFILLLLTASAGLLEAQSPKAPKKAAPAKNSSFSWGTLRIPLTYSTAIVDTEAEPAAMLLGEEIRNGKTLTQADWTAFTTAHPVQGLRFVISDLANLSSSKLPNLVESLRALEGIDHQAAKNERPIISILLALCTIREALKSDTSLKGDEFHQALTRANDLLNTHSVESFPAEPVDSFSDRIKNAVKEYRRAVQLDWLSINLRCGLLRLALDPRYGPDVIDAQLQGKAKNLVKEDRVHGDTSKLAEKLRNAHRDRISKSRQ